MKKLRVISIIPLMLLGAFLVPSLAHAATGVVSINGGNLVSVVDTATTVSVPFQISGSDSFNAFDIQVVADPTILSGASVTLGSVLSSPTILVECINGIKVTGSACSTSDVLGVVHLALTSLSSTTAPTSGVLFTINYNIVGSSPGTPISFLPGCVGTSIANSDCVTFSNAGATISETDQGATFSNKVDFSMTPAFAKLSSPSGASITDLISYAAVGGYKDLLSESVSSTAGLSCALTSGTVDLTASTTGSDTLTCSGTATGSVTVTATGQGIFTPPIPLRSHSTTIAVLIAPAGFTVSLSQSSVSVSRGNSDSSTTITLAGVSGFSGVVSFTPTSSQTGISGAAPMATLTHDASGYGTSTSTLTVSVASSVATGAYTLTVTGMSGTSSSSASISVIVPGQDFAVIAIPNAISIIRGGSLASNIKLVSLGNFAGSATFSASITPDPGQQDSCCLTNNITPTFAPATQTLTAGGTAIVSFFASSIGGSAPPATFTATGNYTAVITATIGGVPHTAIIIFNIEDFTIGPSFCNDITASNTPVYTTPNGNDFPVFLHGQCSALTITDEPNVLNPGDTSVGFQGGPTLSNQLLWVQTNALGGLVTNGFNGTPAIAALNNQIPPNGIDVPQLASVFPAPKPGRVYPTKMCLLPTFWENGTQIPYSYLEANGPLITPGGGLYAALSIILPASFPPGALGNWGCKFDAGAFPNDRGVDALNDFLQTHFNRRHTHTLCELTGPQAFPAPGDNGCPYITIPNNPDFFAVTAMAIQGTLAGTYTFQLCGQGGVLVHCNTYTLHVVKDPILHQLVVFKKTISFTASGGSLVFKIGVTNPDVNKVFAQVTVTGIGSLGDTFTVTSPEVTIAPNANANNIFLTVALPNTIGESFTFSFSIAVSLDPNNLDGTSTAQSVQQTFTITP